MTGIVLHSFRRCPFAIRVRMALEEKGIEYQILEEDLSAPSSDLLKINPSGQVPVLVHEGRVIPESAVITEYLEEHFPLPALIPSGSLQKIRTLTQWCDQRFKPDLDLFKYEWESLTTPAVKDALLLRLRDHLARIEELLEDQLFLLGERITLADIHLSPFYRQLTRARPGDPGLLMFPRRLNAWLERIVARPSFARAMMATSLSGRNP